MNKKQKKKTPSKSTNSPDISTESFSPILVASPSRQQTQGNLTGSARKLKDGAADLHNYIEKWASLNADGANLISDISNLKLERILSKTEETSDSELFPDELLPLLEKLEKILSGLDKVLSRLNGLVEMSTAIAELEKFRHGEADAFILFQTWDVDRFASAFAEIHEMYRKELEVKHCIKENICHAADRTTIMFYSAAWIHQPYIDNVQADLLLESMLRETEHKT